MSLWKNKSRRLGKAIWLGKAKELAQKYFRIRNPLDDGPTGTSFRSNKACEKNIGRAQTEKKVE